MSINLPTAMDRRQEIEKHIMIKTKEKKIERYICCCFSGQTSYGRQLRASGID